jgi:hypothetical protein
MSLRHLALGAGAMLGLFLASSSSRADTALEIRDYRRLDRTLPESKQNFAFELRLGPYHPRVDEGFSGGQKPYETAFGTGNSFFIGLEVDWQALRIPYVGTLGPGFGWGYTSRSSNAKISGTNIDSAEQTKLSIMPMYLAGVLRIDYPARETGIPLVPYGKLGLGMGLWSASNDEGVSERDGVTGRGRSWGTTAALGGMFLLDIFERSTALGFDEEVGVNNSYVFFEWQWLDLGTLTTFENRPQMHVGNKGWVAGVALEF